MCKYTVYTTRFCKPGTQNYVYIYMYISILLLLYPFLTRWFDEPEGTRVAHEARAAGSSNEKMLLQKHPEASA